ncbi:hypothetical protein Pmani_038120 [Petrolisthes manimaculis]|uniref:Uncharacterized protein n=1 Tax=Petrolisthes manimaculis TaxID=1843537 RepID=A0AAE1NGU3_9EUCA|nr:hypothetical protein Pmani_038120 [Petrolisthes manimaculis]
MPLINHQPVSVAHHVTPTPSHSTQHPNPYTTAPHTPSHSTHHLTQLSIPIHTPRHPTHHPTPLTISLHTNTPHTPHRPTLTPHTPPTPHTIPYLPLIKPLDNTPFFSTHTIPLIILQRLILPFVAPVHNSGINITTLSAATLPFPSTLTVA